MIVVRLAETADIPALLAIEHSAAEAFRATEYAWVADDTVTEVVAYPDLVAARTVWVAEAAGVPVGFVASRRHDTELHVLELDVHYDYQRKRIGRALMARAIEAACNTGCVAVTLTTFRDVAWNAPFYRRLGFEILEMPPPHLSDILAIETEHGFTSRCAMRLELRGSRTQLASGS